MSAVRAFEAALLQLGFAPEPLARVLRRHRLEGPPAHAAPRRPTP